MTRRSELLLACGWGWTFASHIATATVALQWTPVVFTAFLNQRGPAYYLNNIIKFNTEESGRRQLLPLGLQPTQLLS